MWQAFLVAKRERAYALLDAAAGNGEATRAVASQPFAARYEDVERQLRTLEASSALFSSGSGARPPAATIPPKARPAAEAHSDECFRVSHSGISMKGCLTDKHLVDIEFADANNLAQAAFPKPDCFQNHKRTFPGDLPCGVVIGG